MDESRPSTLLEIKSVTMTFAGVHALKGVSFSVADGEVHALMGENGAGKSTLMKIISGVYSAYGGTLELNGLPLKMNGPRDAQKHGIAIVHQELSLIPGLTVAENIYLGHEPRTSLGLIDRKAMVQATQALLDRFQLDLAPTRKASDLRVGEQQIIEVAKAVSRGARLLILDEPTSALSAAEIRHLFSVIATLKQEGVTIIYISHKLDEIFELADNITVLRDGEFVGTMPTSETNAAELIAMKPH
jgi:ABC-type sugar transport system ATPase subunit